MLFELIQVALNEREKLSCVPSDEKWADLFVASKKQAVAGMVLFALEILSKQGIRLPTKLLFEWIGISEQIKIQNKIVNKRCADITKLFADYGFKTCILKGQGNSLLYPEPLLRTSGDIDIWVEGSREDIKNFVVLRCPKAQDGDMHIDFPIFDDVPVEVHYKPRYSSVPKYDKRLQTWFKEQAETQFTNKVELEGFEICVPTAEFNAVQQMSHIMGHFFVEGIGLRQFVDYYYVLKKLHDEKSSVDFEKLFKDFGLLQFARGVMWLEHEKLGLNKEYLICETDEKLGKVILKEIEEGGNFGHHDQRYAFRKKGYLARGLVDCYRLMKLAYYFPQDALWKIVRKIENQKWKINS